MIPNSHQAFLDLFRRLQGEKGQALTEYGLILVLVALACVLALVFVAGSISALLNAMANVLDTAL